MKNEIFDDLRPYYDEEIPAAMERIASSEYFSALALFIYPGINVDEVRRGIRSHSTIRDFQLNTMKDVNEQVISRSIRNFTYEGIDALDKNERYLFVSNHRDIMLDSSLLQYALYQSGHQTTEITFGSNLMSSQLMVDIGRSNKMFKVMRGGNAKDFYRNSLHLSRYLHYAIQEKRESVWIAQRNGRTKDGIDATDQGIVKLFYMGQSADPVKALLNLHIVPVAISYQWEPCDRLKARELYTTRRNGVYVKEPDEDLKSILTGLMQPKGNVHIAVGEPLGAKDLEPLRGCPNTKFNKQVAALIDRQIHRNFRLTCNNYIAHDLRSDTGQYAAHYTSQEKRMFIDHLYQCFTPDTEDKALLRDIFLGIYANPLK
jgi:1-acyl-sn-glycerol-3-phosphate acyltransferase